MEKGFLANFNDILGKIFGIYNKKSTQHYSNTFTQWNSLQSSKSKQEPNESNSSETNPNALNSTITSKKKKIYYTLFDKNDCLPQMSLSKPSK